MDFINNPIIFKYLRDLEPEEFDELVLPKKFFLPTFLVVNTKELSRLITLYRFTGTRRIGICLGGDMYSQQQNIFQIHLSKRAFKSEKESGIRTEETAMKSRICFIIGVLANTGGTERVCTMIANALSDRYDVTILSTWHMGEPPFDIEESVHVDYPHGTLGRENIPSLPTIF